MAKKSSSDDDEVATGRKAFARIEEAESDNRATYIADQSFAIEEKQWPDDIRKQREIEGRPVLTINKLKTFARQVINDSRQNKPSVKVNPVDDTADPETAEIFNGVIRNIQNVSNADVCFDTAIECAVYGGWGYWRITLDYAYDDSFDMDIGFKRVANPLSIYGDPNSTEADSSDWDESFVVDRLTKAQFKATYGDKSTTDFDSGAWQQVGEKWISDDTVMVAEWWTREKVDRPIVLLSDGQIVDQGELKANAELRALLATGELQVKGERVTKSCKVTQKIMSGAEILKTTAWPGKYIPIVPVYGEEFNIGGKRILRSLVHSAIDPQRMFNYWRTNATELVALAPRVPFIGPKGAFSDPRWATANTRSHAFLEYDTKAVAAAGGAAPQRQPLDTGAAAGSLQEAMNASDDIKAVIGMFDASLGAKSNETSGRAIMARQREGDVATFHFTDNMARSIRHTGRILIDLIPKVYDKPRIVRTLGEDGSIGTAKLKQPVPVTDDQGQPMMDEQGQPATRIYDLAVGKYDLTVTTGPSFTTRRQEAATEMTEFIRSYPEAAPVIGDLLVKNLDWPGADEIAERLKKMVPGDAPQIPDEAQQQIEEGKKLIEDQAAEIERLKTDISVDQAKIASAEKVKMIDINSKEAIEKIQLQSQERIEAARLQSQERISTMQIASQARIASDKAAQAAEAARNKPQPNER
jgi:hypothetical protein